MAPGLQKFEILLDSSDNTFSPGQVVAGRVILELSKPKSLRGLKVRIKGKAEVKWSESTGSGRDKKTTSHTAEEEYFRIECNLLNGPALASGNSENVEIQPGYHVYPFTFSLPRNIPSSFKTTHGNVTYTVKAVIDRPWKFDHIAIWNFDVETPFDLSEYGSATNAINDVDEKTFYAFPCCPVGSMKIHVKVPTSGYAVGDSIQATVFANNQSARVDVTAVKLRLNQIISLFARSSRVKKYNNVIQKTKRDGPFQKNDAVTIGMQVPSVPLSNLPHCSIIDVQYRLHVRVSVSGCHCAMEKTYPIVIGTRSVSMQSGVLTMQPTAPTAPFFPNINPTTTIPMPFPVPIGGYTTDNGITEPYNPISYHSTAMQNTFGNPAGFQYPPVVYPPIIGWQPPLQMPSTNGSAENPPPSYDDCMKTGQKQ